MCTPIESNAFANGQSLTTYGVNKEIVNANNVNIYDGVNSYMGTINTGQYLKAVNSFKESQNVLASPNVYNTTRSPILRIEPNSITKIRAYIWIEGQDLDNVDYLGDSKKLLINFGFTKNIYEEEDVYPTPTS